MRALFEFMRSVGRKISGTRDDVHASADLENLFEKDSPGSKDLVRRLREQRMELTGNRGRDIWYA